MTRLPAPPPEPPQITSLDGCAPKFKSKLVDTLLDLANQEWHPIVRESLRTDERQSWLFGFGREWDDGRGIVTNAPTGVTSWHRYGLAADIGDRRYDPGQEPAAFWAALERAAITHGLVSGADWTFCDKPHVQFGPGMRTSPSEHAAALLASGGFNAVWHEVNAL